MMSRLHLNGEIKYYLRVFKNENIDLIRLNHQRVQIYFVVHTVFLWHQFRNWSTQSGQQTVLFIPSVRLRIGVPQGSALASKILCQVFNCHLCQI